jgi:hypothetical protein
MGLPCPHCGGDQEFTERNPDEIKPIIPLDLQESFRAPLISRHQVKPMNNPQKHPLPSFPLNASNKMETVSPPTVVISPPHPPSTSVPVSPQSPPFKLSKTVSMTDQSDKTQISNSPFLKSFLPTFKSGLEDTVSREQVKNHFKRLEAHVKQINSKQKQYETQVNKLQLNIKEMNKKLQKYEKSVKILSKANQKFESIHKDTTKNLKKLF